MRKRTNFFKLLQLWAIFSLIAVGSSIIVFDIAISYRDFNVQAKQIHADYIVRQKEMIKQEVDRVVDMINHEKAQSEAVTKEKIKSRVYEAYAIAQHIYQQNKAVKSKVEIRQMIIDVLRPIRFAEGRGYYFATRMDGVEVLFADKPEFEGLALLDVRDTHGKYVVKEMIETVRQSGEGFCEYYWTKPGVEGNDFKKISFAKRVEPFDWFIGTGLYVDDIEASIKAKLMGLINKIRFGVNGYIFVDTWQGISLAHGIQPELIGTNMWETEDSKGNKTTQMLIAAARKDEGGYVNYWWRKSSTGEESPKIAYAKSIPEWEILVGTGVYLDDVKADIAVMQSKLNTRIKTKIFYFVLIVIGVITFFIFFLRHLNRRLENDFNLFSSFFGQAAHSNEVINRELVQFIEFDRLAKDTNKMLHDKNYAQQNLLAEKNMLRESEKKYRSMMEAISDPVYICSDDYRVEYMNPAMIKRTGRDATGEPCYQALHDFDQPCSWCNCKKEFYRKYFETEVVSPKDDHSYHVSHSPVVNEDGSVSSIIIFRDITELKAMETQLFQSQKMESIGNLAGGVAHDFNNILTAIYGYSEMALDHLEEGSAVWQDVHEIQKSGERAANLTRQLLAFSRKQVIMPKTVNINNLINDMRKMLSRLISEDIQLETELAEQVGPIYADPGQVEQIILNLVVNARDAVKNQPEGAKKIIKMSTSQVFLDSTYITTHLGSSLGQYLLLQVEDTGCGMSKEVLNHIFEPFYTTKGEGEGTGMGLATVYGIVKQNRGSVNVYSEPEQGATFKIYWPIMEGEVVEEADHELQPAAGGTEVILLAEDDNPIREIACRQLRKAGYTVIAAADGREALEKAVGYEKPIDFLFTDAIMPIMGGKKLSEKIKEIYPDIHVLFASGYMDNGIHQEILTLGKDRFINKPYNIQDVMIKIRRLLDDKGS